MRRASITLPDDLEAALDAYLRDHGTPPGLPAVVQTALREYLSERGYLPPARPLRISPAEQGSGLQDVSVEHDRYLTEE